MSFVFFPIFYVYSITQAIRLLIRIYLSSEDTIKPSTVSAPTDSFEDRKLYQYSDLPGDQYFRILFVPASWSTKANLGLECALKTVLLDRRVWEVNIYESVSYTWDDQEPDRYVLCDGKKLAVTRNIEAILYGLRLPHRPRLLWIDAVCINQRSEEEKSKQIKLMGRIYKNSLSVIVWLGDSTAGSDLVFDYLELYSVCEFLCDKFPESISTWVRQMVVSSSSSEWTWNGVKSSTRLTTCTGRQYDRLFVDMICRNWWKRVWTIQEAVLAPQVGEGRIIARCGKAEIDFDNLTKGLIAFVGGHNIFATRYPLNAIVWIDNLGARLWPRTWLSGQEKMDVRALMHQIRACRSMDPRDRIYGLYGIFQDLRIQLPDISYSKTKEQIYWEFTVAFCKRTQSLELVTLASELCNGRKAPTWVPDFSGVYRIGDLFGDTKASKKSQPRFQFLANDTNLLVSGRIVDFVCTKSNHTTRQPKDVARDVQDNRHLNLFEGSQQTVRAFRDWYRLLSAGPALNRYESEDNLKLVFAEILTVAKAHSLKAMPVALDRTSFRTWIDLLLLQIDRTEYLEHKKVQALKDEFLNSLELRYLTESEEWETLCILKTHPKIDRIHHTVWMLTRDNTCFVTRKGYVGTALYCLKEGDAIVLLAGVDRPMILRRVSEGSQGYRIVGPAYIHDMMEGELWDDDADLSEFCLL